MEPRDTVRTPVRVVDDRDVVDAVRRAIAETIGVQIDDVPHGAALLTLGMQSFDFVDLVQKLEQRYEIRLPRAYAIPNALAVGDYVDAVMRALRGEL